MEIQFIHYPKIKECLEDFSNYPNEIELCTVVLECLVKSVLMNYYGVKNNHRDLILEEELLTEFVLAKRIDFNLIRYLYSELELKILSFIETRVNHKEKIYSFAGIRLKENNLFLKFMSVEIKEGPWAW